MAEAFDSRRAQELAAAFKKHGVRYLFIGKGAAIIMGFPDTTQDIDIFPQKSDENGRAIAAALQDLGFPLTGEHEAEIVRGKDFIQIRYGPFLVDLVFAPDGIERFEDAEKRSLVIEGLPVCHIDDIIRSKEAANRVRDRETLPRLKAFRDWWVQQASHRTS